MVGPKGSFFLAEDQTLTLEAANALVDLHAAGIALVLVSGRTRPQLVEAAAIFGADGFIGELGAIVGWDQGRSSEILRGAMPEHYSQVPEELLHELIAANPGRLELHTPWHTGRELDVMFRGKIDIEATDAWLSAAGFDWLSLRDNGLIAPHHMPHLGAIPHVYHLVPEGVGKGEAVAWDLKRRGIDPADAIAIGDSASDLIMARYVGRMHLVANALNHPDIPALLPAYDNVVVEPEPVTLGWASAVRACLPR
ncbi:HAD hydrolase family protein [Frankia sp. CNm7]|uniref:HAD hydrolase family protein n=1 Tax=Frankia nepalensis TaxID=1836974 RepID=A0A937UQB8_9ACTN|nr:HAD hydrolase family protein [Frankia nepalensis]MBL7494709.1 HAD hydrolase family protein [Frankia nepalensis]MBL7514130.1 HAD hydrolase family protein [Frankia nepalensis]MBL7523384.1 HAD hydrolase family protein [Frankia nepalensis]MBL7626506.1 HAD hydrolase family protein [Frankia nepalensis]